MRKVITSTILISAILCFSTLTYGGKYKKLAQTGLQYLSVETDARATAMAGAMTTVCNGSASLFANPATLALMNGMIDATFSQNSWIADIKHNMVSAAYRPLDGKFGVVGVSMISVDYGKMQGTMAWPNDQGYIDTEMFNPTALAVGVGYAKSLSSQFAIGGHLKYAGQQLGKSIVEIEDSLAVRKYKVFAPAFDFGTHFKTGWKSVAFGMSVRNFSSEIKYENEGFQLPLTFQFGVSMDLIDFVPEMLELHKLICSIDAAHPRSYPEYINVGLEYAFKDLLAIRYGYMGNRDE
ncbi:MAG: PorV/PorQ family protein, partial [Candidatus Marinimicrobia bacterium]|nr:PorV/PorQ family protein [Candidatus Neomarinimicrobiota bacterium]